MGRVYKTRPFGVKVGGMRGLNPSGICSFLLELPARLTHFVLSRTSADNDTLITPSGPIIRATPILPDMRHAHRGAMCARTVLAPKSRGKILEPSMGEREVRRGPGRMVLVHNRWARVLP
jgi:hypothetical protein